MDLSGKSGGEMVALVDTCLRVPSDSTPRMQEAHALIIYILSGIVENAFVAVTDTCLIAASARV
jgi:D-sedoheptulose 7-phosphate isomerase